LRDTDSPGGPYCFPPQERSFTQIVAKREGDGWSHENLGGGTEQAVIRAAGSPGLPLGMFFLFPFAPPPAEDPRREILPFLLALRPFFLAPGLLPVVSKRPESLFSWFKCFSFPVRPQPSTKDSRSCGMAYGFFMFRPLAPLFLLPYNFLVSNSAWTRL